MANCSNLTTAFYLSGNFEQALCIRSCHEDLILTRKSHSCAGIAFIQGDSAGGSKLIEQALIPSFAEMTLVFEPFFNLLSLSFSCLVVFRSSEPIAISKFEVRSEDIIFQKLSK